MREREAPIRAETFAEVRDALDVVMGRLRWAEAVKEPQERFQIGHQIEAVLAWFSAQPSTVQDSITIEGRRLVRLLAERDGPGPFGPGTFPPPKPEVKILPSAVLPLDLPDEPGGGGEGNPGPAHNGASKQRQSRAGRRRR